MGTLTTLSDVQNSLFVPDLGRWVDRSRYLRLTRPTRVESDAASITGTLGSTRPRASSRAKTPSIAPSSGTIAEEPSPEEEAEEIAAEDSTDHIVARGKYMVLPEGLVDWEHWEEKDREELDDYVRHLLHSKKWKAKRTWRGFKQYFKTRMPSPGSLAGRRELTAALFSQRWERS